MELRVGDHEIPEPRSSWVKATFRMILLALLMAAVLVKKLRRWR